MEILKVFMIDLTEEPENNSIAILILAVPFVAGECNKLHRDHIKDSMFRRFFHKIKYMWHRHQFYWRFSRPTKERAKLMELRTKVEDYILSQMKNVGDLVNCSSSESEVDDAAGASSMHDAAILSVTKKSRQQPDNSQLISRGKDLEMNNSYDIHVIGNESRGCSELIKLGPKAVQVEPGDARRKRKQACKSKVWLHFTKVEDPEGSGVVKEAQCKYCGKLLKADPKIHGTSCLRRHITDVHQMELDGSPSTKRVAPTTNKLLSAADMHRQNPGEI